MYLVYFLLKLHLKFQDIAAKNCVGVKIKKRSLIVFKSDLIDFEAHKHFS